MGMRQGIDMSRAITGLLLFMAAFLSGCATRTMMAYSDESKTVVAPSSAVFLMTATIKNGYHDSFQPKLLVVNVETVGAKTKADRLNFTMDKQAKFKESDTPEEGNSYLLRMELPPGEYVIHGLTCIASRFPVNGIFFAPLHANVTSARPGVYYLGHVEADIRERSGTEFKAGPSLPLIDQAVAGASGGTFDIEISDRWGSDEPLFRGALPKLGTTVAQKAVLPPFDRPKAQDWWEKH
jgi:hypothetical protein